MYRETHEAQETQENRENREKRLPDHFEDDYKLKANVEYDAKEYHYKTDSKGRISRAEGTLRLEKDNKANPKAQREAGGEDRRTDSEKEGGVDDGGHFIARQFGGSPEIDNLFAQDRHFNRSDYKKMEREFESKLSEKDEDNNPRYQVDVRIDAKYKGDSERPDKVFVYAKYTRSDGYEEKKIYQFRNESDPNTRVKEL